MKVMLTAVAITALALSPGAFAQTSTSGSTSSPTAGSPANANPGSQNPAVVQRIRQDLANAGFTDVKVVAESYVVQAKSKDGDPVLMTIGPHGMSVFEAMNGNGSSNSNTTGMNSHSNSGSGSPSAGPSNK